MLDLQIHQERPRELRWFHASSMLFGDWGTSRLYVLGLALFYSAGASVYHVIAMCMLMSAVAWAYTIVCRSFQDGGGVYSAARSVNKRVAVVGAMLLFASYVITAAISAVAAFRYLGFGVENAPAMAILSILLIGAINFVGPKSAGRFATLIAAATLVITLILAGFCVPHVSEGLSNISFTTRGVGKEWISFVHIILALSGVEAVANMTGVMVKPVGRTSKLSIWPVLGEVVVFNLLFAVAMLAISGAPLAEPLADKASMSAALTADEAAYRDTILNVMARGFVHDWFATVASFVFAMLLLSAVNTAVAGMISVQYVMAQDNEMPPAFLRLNAFGVPWIGLVVACGTCCGTLLFFGEVDKLGHLYAIGVVGAIAVNLTSTFFNNEAQIGRIERAGLLLIAAFLLVVEGTIIATQYAADLFVVIVLVGGYAMRAGMRKAPELEKHLPKMAETVGKLFQPPPVPETGELFSRAGIPPFDPGLSKILVATRGNPKLLGFAAEEAVARKANLIVLFVRDLRLRYGPPGSGKYRPEDDPEAIPVFSRANKLAREKKIPFMPIYCVARSASEMILDFAGTYAVDYVIMGVTRRGALYRALNPDYSYFLSRATRGGPPEGSGPLLLAERT
ncbi:MAG: amino acid permease, partial [Phycisphaerae bacterium]|nr:amino acid permease [Phycisphaerae bacterium]